MATMSISLPEPMKQFIEQQIKAGSYGTASEYLRSLVRAEQERQTKLAALRRDVQVGLDDIAAGRISTMSIAQIKAKARRQFEARKKA